jgi:signal transduction histidine kinase
MGKSTKQKADSIKAQAPSNTSPKSPASVLASNRQLKRKIFDFYTILELSRNFNAVLDLKALLQTFIGALYSQIKVEKVAIFQIRGKRTKKFELVCWRDNTKPPERSFIEGNSKIAEQFKEDTTTISIEKLLRATNNKYEKIFLEDFDPGFAVPLFGRSELNGILFVGPKADHSGFSKEDEEFLSILSGQIAVAMENARLYEAEKRAIAELQSTQEQLVHTERLAALGEMSAKIAHEINNPLGIIKNYLMLIGKARQDTAQSHKYLEIVGSEIERITGIVRELLHFHKPQSIDFQKINVLNVLENVLAFLNPQLERSNIKLEKRFAPDCPEVEASAEGLKQVFINVILNAVDAMPDGGTIEVIASKHQGDLRIQIKDNGPGVSDEMLPRIFEPFFTTKEEGKGTGLGLSVCYGIIKKHQGVIDFKNLESGGCIEIILPSKMKDDERTE